MGRLVASTSALAQLLPFLSAIDKGHGVDAVLEVLQELDVMRFDPVSGIINFRPLNVSPYVFDKLLEEKLDAR